MAENWRRNAKPKAAEVDLLEKAAGIGLTGLICCDDLFCQLFFELDNLGKPEVARIAHVFNRRRIKAARGFVIFNDDRRLIER